MSKDSYTEEQQIAELNKTLSPETKESKLENVKGNQINPDYANEHMWNITREQTASLQALHQSMQHAGMTNNLSTLTAVAQQQLQPHPTQAQQNHLQQHSPQQQLQYQQQQQQQQQQTLPSQQTQQQGGANETGQKEIITSTSKDDTKPPVGSEEWHRLRRENHKQVERRRRETINEGINEIARIVPGCEKNKGSILHRAAAYIRQLKENESSTLEKWTLEKLLTDQAISELNRQVEILKVELDRLNQENAYLKRTLDEAPSNDMKRQKMGHHVPKESEM